MSLSPFTSPGHTSHAQQVRMPMPPTTERNKWINDIKCKPTNEDIQSANIGNTEQTDAETTDTYNNLIQMQTYERRQPIHHHPLQHSFLNTISRMMIKTNAK
eukprot:421941_1